MNAVQSCYLLTDELISTLQKATTEHRDKAIENIQKLLSKREQLLPMIKPPFSDQEVMVGKQLIQKQNELDHLLMKTKQEIQRDINGISKKRTSMKRYTNPYENIQTDGFFYDKRN